MTVNDIFTFFHTFSHKGNLFLMFMKVLETAALKNDETVFLFILGYSYSQVFLGCKETFFQYH